MMRVEPKKLPKAFTLVELLIVVVIIAVLAGIAIPKISNAGERSREASLKGDLKLVTNAIQLYYNDTGTFPQTLNALLATNSPVKGLNASGSAKNTPPKSYRGPYLIAVPLDAVSGLALHYSTTPPTVGHVTPSATGNDLQGVPFSSYDYSGN